MSCDLTIDRVRSAVLAAAEMEIRLTATVPRPQAHLFADDWDQPYVGYVETRDFVRGEDAAAAVEGLGIAAAALPASHLLVVWEQADLTAALEQPPAAGNALAFLVATADDHSLIRHPFTVTPGIDTPLEISWGAARGRHHAPLPAPVADLLARWRETRPPDFATTVAMLSDDGYVFTAVAPLPGADPARALDAALDTAAAAAREAFETIAPEAVERACQALRDALALMPDKDPRRGLYLVELSQLRQLRYEHGGDLDDVTAAIQAAREAADYPPGDSPARRLDALGTALRVWYEATGDRAALDESLMAGSAALAALPDDDDNVATCLVNLASARHARFQATGEVEELDRAISEARRALGRRRLGDDGWQTIAMTLCNSLEARYALTGDLAVLDEAIGLGRAAAATPTVAGWLRAARLANLARVLDGRYRRTGELQSLREAVDAGRVAVATVPPGHPEHARYQLVLSESLRALFDRTGEPADLDAAFQAARAGTTAIPAGHPDHVNHLIHLAVLHLDRDRFRASPADVEAAVSLLREARAAAWAAHSMRPAAQALLGDALRVQGDPAAIDEAVDLARTALASLSSDHPRRGTFLNILAGTLEARHAVRGDLNALAEAVGALRTAAAHRTAPVGVRLDAARTWGEIAAGAGQVDLAAEGLATAVRLLPLRATRGLRRPDAEYWLGRLAGLARDAAALAVADGSPERAVELLELGRTVLLGQALNGRTDLSALRERDPALADRFEWLSAQMESGDTGTDEERRAWADELDKLVARARRLPGLDRFLLPPVAADLVGQADEGPVVLVNVSTHRSDALLVTPDGIRALPLPDLSPGRLAEVVARFLLAVNNDLASPYRDRRARAEGVITETLTWLWDTVAGPVLDALAPAPGDRLWWVPTGPLTLLPLHAAGHPDGPSVLDRSVPSYAPSIRALAHARARAAAAEKGPGTTLVVGMPSTPGGADLPGVLREVESVAERAPQVHTLVGGGATSDAVLAAMEESAWAHFACHATTAASPSESYLLLHDHAERPLTAGAVSRLRLRSASLAYLSACETAVTTTHLADEVIHIASAFHLAGYPRVIGTLWSVDDAAAETIARGVYGILTAHPPDPDRAARALHDAVTRLRDEQPRHPSRWASHVHLGA